jgi:hypothetical protein
VQNVRVTVWLSQELQQALGAQGISDLFDQVALNLTQGMRTIAPHGLEIECNVALEELASPAAVSGGSE